ncbi:hypothetical protein CPC08DRAFT_755620 [Agrocybe pediades]|nr:hypothetical protein CPC08DRAFT_755620 [Agrocybe pediades]
MIPPLTLHPSTSSQRNIMHRVSDPYSTQLRRKLRPLLPKPKPASGVHPSSIHSQLLEASISPSLVASIQNKFSGTRTYQHRNLPTGARTRPTGIITHPNLLASPSHPAPVQSAITRQRNHPYRRPIAQADIADKHLSTDSALAQPEQPSPSIPAIHPMNEEHGSGDKISSSKKRKREAITTKASLSSTPEARTPSQRNIPPPCRCLILQQNFYDGKSGKFKSSIPGAEGGMMKTPEDYQTGNASWQTPNPKRRRLS